MKDDQIIAAVRRWVELVIIELNLCPFAKRELVKNRIHFVVTDATSEDQLLMALQSELERLNSDPDIETILLIHPHVLLDFYDYNQFLSIADSLLVQMELEGIYQLASFHPDYQFAGTEPEDVENYTNRSPHPMLHILREDSLDRAIADYPDVDQIPTRNIEVMNSLGKQKLQVLMYVCLHDAGEE